MKIEKLRKNHKKELVIGTILTVVIGGALTFKLTHSKYRTTQSIDLATGVINYIAPDFKIMAMYKNDGSGDVSIDSMPTDGYVINTTKSYCDLNGSKDNNVVIENVNGKPLFSGLNKGDKCYLYFDKIKITNVDSLIANLTINNYSPTFNNIASTDEGVFQTSDGMYGGTTYYWRGAASTNYVKFAGFCWRIIRINGDKTMRLIYDGSSCHANGTNTTENIAVTNQAYNPTYDASYYVGWTQNGTQRTNSTTATASNAKSKTESWYNSNIGNNATYSAKVADGKFCNNRNAKSGQSWVSTGTSFQYAAYERLKDNKTPTFNCNNAGDVYTLKVGAITADEVAFAGGVYGTANSSYYLYNGQNYWTMSPFEWGLNCINEEGMCFVTDSALVFVVNSGGYLNNFGVDYTLGLRPVINLRSDVTFSSGNGEQISPYIVS